MNQFNTADSFDVRACIAQPWGDEPIWAALMRRQGMLVELVDENAVIGCFPEGKTSRKRPIVRMKDDGIYINGRRGYLKQPFDPNAPSPHTGIQIAHICHLMLARQFSKGRLIERDGLDNGPINP